LAETEGTTVIVSSHLLSEMELICDRIAVIHHGKLIDVKLIKEMVQLEKDDLQVVYFHVDQPKKVRDVLLKLGWTMTARGLQEGFEIVLTKEQVAELNAQMVATGIRVYEIKCLKTSLEDRFLELTRGD
jgi:ABC-2 type transport system ATP-binding protein